MPRRIAKSKHQKVVRVDPVTHAAVKRAALESGSAVGTWASDVLRKAANQPRLSILNPNHVNRVIDQNLKANSELLSREKIERKARVVSFLVRLNLSV